MTEVIQKPSFRETVRYDTIDLDDVGLSFRTKSVDGFSEGLSSLGRNYMNFFRLRQADYGEGFRISTVSELIPLVYASLENTDHTRAQGVLRTLEKSLLTGNTAIHYFPEGIFVEDNPAIKNKRLVTPVYQKLESRLGSHEERGVVFSDDRSVRFTPHGFETKEILSSNLAKNSGIIAFSGGEENSERLAILSEYWPEGSFFWTFENFDSPQTRVACLAERSGFQYRLGVIADLYEGQTPQDTFGVKELKE